MEDVVQNLIVTEPAADTESVGNGDDCRAHANTQAGRQVPRTVPSRKPPAPSQFVRKGFRGTYAKHAEVDAYPAQSAQQARCGRCVARWSND